MTRGAALAALRRLASRRSLLLSYHGLGPPGQRGDDHWLMVDPGRFRAQVELLLEAGFRFETVAGIARVLPDDGGPPPPGLVSVSFDDGMHDNHELLLPLLGEYELPATVYVTTGMIGKPNPWLAGERMMTEAELRDLAAAGFELGAHTVSHPDMEQLNYEDCLREMTESRDEVARIAGRPVETFAYPFCKYGTTAVAAARDAGFVAAVTCIGRGSWERYELKRQMITGKDGATSFALKAGEVYEPLFDSPPGKAFRATTRGLRARLRGRG